MDGNRITAFATITTRVRLPASRRQGNRPTNLPLHGFDRNRV
jgi:hypothetical protein